MNKATILELVIKNVIFIQQCFSLPIINPIILESDFLDTYFTVLNISDHTITLHRADYMLTTSLTHDPIDDYRMAKIVVLATTELLHKEYRKEVQKNTPRHVAIVQH